MMHMGIARSRQLRFVVRANEPSLVPMNPPMGTARHPHALHATDSRLGLHHPL